LIEDVGWMIDLPVERLMEVRLAGKIEDRQGRWSDWETGRTEQLVAEK
jgi:hypothetical protein